MMHMQMLLISYQFLHAGSRLKFILLIVSQNINSK